MIKVRIIKRNPMLQEALDLDSMGIPKILATLIREDLERREDQVRLALILKDEAFTAETSEKLMSLLSLGGNNYIFKSVSEKVSDPLYRAAARYTSPHYKIAHGGQYYDVIKGKVKLPNPWPAPSDVDVNRPLTLTDVKGMRKSFKKFVKRKIKNEGAAADLNNKIEDSMDELVVDFYNSKIRQNMGGETLIAYLLDHPTNEKSLDGMNIDEAIKHAFRYEAEKEDPDNIIFKYNKGGLFWYNIGESSCSIEAERMGHCGADDRGVLYSLRSKTKNQKISDSHVSLSYNEQEDAIYQIKGKGNCTPIAKYGPYIVDFLKKMEVVRVYETGEHSDCDFTEFIKYLEQKHPEAVYGDGHAKVEEAVEAINNGDYNDEHLTFYADDMSYDADVPMLRIDANVGFTIELDFLKDYHDLDFIEELWDDDREKVKEDIIDACDFEDYDTYSDGLDMTWDTQEEIPRLVVSIHLSPYNNDTATDLESAESAIRDISLGYTSSDIEDHVARIKKIVYKQFEDVLNPDGREMYHDIVNNIEKLRDNYQYFNVEGDEDSIQFSATVPLPIKVKGIPNGGRYSGMPYDRALNYYGGMVTRAINAERYTKKLDDLLDIEHKRAKDAAARQVKLPFKDFDLEEPKSKFEKPFSFNVNIIQPRGILVRKGQTQSPKIEINLEIHNVDNKATILFVMHYIKFLEERLEYVIDKLNFSQAQAKIDKAYSDAIKEIPNYKPLQENKKRKISVKIRR